MEGVRERGRGEGVRLKTNKQQLRPTPQRVLVSFHVKIDLWTKLYETLEHQSELYYIYYDNHYDYIITHHGDVYGYPRWS